MWQMTESVEQIQPTEGGKPRGPAAASAYTSHSYQIYGCIAPISAPHVIQASHNLGAHSLTTS
jgi:hypothetical protein